MLVEFSDEVKNLFASIEALGERDHLCNPILLQELFNKLPTFQKLSWVGNISNEDITCELVKFFSWLES